MMFSATARIVATSERRDSARRPVERPSTLRDPLLRARDIMVDELSASGCRFITDAVFAVGDQVQIGLGGAGQVAGRVSRREGRIYGCAFDEILTPSAFASAFGESSVVFGNFPAYDRTTVVGVEPKWPRAVRLLILLGCALGSWTAIGMAIAYSL